MKRIPVLLFVLFVPIISIFALVSQTKADVEVFTPIFQDTGAFGIVNQGLGIEDPLVYTHTTGITLTGYNVPGPVEEAYLLWQGRHITTGVILTDDEVLLAIEGGEAITVTAISTRTHHHEHEERAGRHYYSFIADITNLDIVQQGTYSYTFSGFDMPDEEWGFSIVTIYDTGGPQLFNLQVLEGFDRFSRFEDEPNQDPGAVHCVDFDGVSTSRPIDLSMIVAGISGANRDNQLYIQTGTGDHPTADLHTLPGVISTTQPFIQSDGPEWDTYENQFDLPATHTWACVQVTVNEDPLLPPGDPASGMLQLISMSVPTTTPTVVSLQDFAVTATNNLLPFLAGLALVLVGTTVVLYRRRA